MSQKSALFARFARPYIRRRLRRSFSDVRMNGLEALRRESQARPLILACNHVAWWDPLLLVHLEQYLGCDGYCLMDADNLQKLPFFKWVGALPVDRGNPQQAYRDVAQASRVLSGPGKVLAIFPHGQQRPAHLPLEFRPGVVALAARASAPVVPLAIRYDYLESPRPIVHLSAGAPLSFSPSDAREDFLAALEDGIQEQMGFIDSALLGDTEPFPSLLGRDSRSDQLARLPAGTSALRLLSQDGAR